MNRLFQDGYRYSRVEETDEGYAIFAEKGRWTRIGVYIVHASVVLLLAGGIIGSIFGFEGFINLPEGDTADHIRLRNNNDVLPLPFNVRCNKFTVSFYETGAPKEFKSSLSILENGKEVFTRDILVNHPLRFNGINIFQSSYGTLAANRVVLNVESKSSGLSYPIKTAVGEPVELPEGMGTFVIDDSIDHYDFMGRDLGQAYVGTLTMEGEKPVQIAIPVMFPKFDKMRGGNFTISLMDFEKRFYTGLLVTKDPGVGVVYCGFIVMIAGIFITFFLSHRRVCVEVTKKGKLCQVMVSGNANKNKFGIDAAVKKLADILNQNEGGEK